MNGKAPFSRIQWDKKISLGHVLILVFWLVTIVYGYAVVSSQVEHNSGRVIEVSKQLESNTRDHQRFVTRDELNLILRSLDELKQEVRELRR